METIYDFNRKRKERLQKAWTKPPVFHDGIMEDVFQDDKTALEE